MSKKAVKLNFLTNNDKIIHDTNTFPIIGPLRGESTGDWWFPLTKGQQAKVGFDVLLDVSLLALNKLLTNVA